MTKERYDCREPQIYKAKFKRLDLKLRDDCLIHGPCIHSLYTFMECLLCAQQSFSLLDTGESEKLNRTLIKCTAQWLVQQRPSSTPSGPVENIKEKGTKRNKTKHQLLLVRSSVFGLSEVKAQSTKLYMFVHFKKCFRHDHFKNSEKQMNILETIREAFTTKTRQWPRGVRLEMGGGMWANQRWWELASCLRRSLTWRNGRMVGNTEDGRWARWTFLDSISRCRRALGAF